jgi:hypothetical protein
VTGGSCQLHKRVESGPRCVGQPVVRGWRAAMRGMDMMSLNSSFSWQARNDRLFARSRSRMVPYCCLMSKPPPTPNRCLT